jgi:hypothetical protein
MKNRGNRYTEEFRRGCNGASGTKEQKRDYQQELGSTHISFLSWNIQSAAQRLPLLRAVTSSRAERASSARSGAASTVRRQRDALETYRTRHSGDGADAQRPYARRSRAPECDARCRRCFPLPAKQFCCGVPPARCPVSPDQCLDDEQDIGGTLRQAPHVPAIPCCSITDQRLHDVALSDEAALGGVANPVKHVDLIIVFSDA